MTATRRNRDHPARTKGRATTGGGDGRPSASVRIRRPASAVSSYASSPGVRSRMQVQRTRDTGPEMALRRLLHASGLRYRVDCSPIRGLRRRADIVFRRAQVAVYVDGCFWHGCPEHGRRQTFANPEYWSEKIRRNKARDADTDRVLRNAGWLVFRIWEHQDPGEAAAEIQNAIKQRATSVRSRHVMTGEALSESHSMEADD